MKQENHQNTSSDTTSKPAEETNLGHQNHVEDKKKNGTLVALIIVIVFALAAMLGTWWYMNNKLEEQKKQNQQQIDELNAKVSTLQTESEKTGTTSGSSTDKTAIEKTISSFYDAWLKGGTSSAKANKAQADGLISAAVTKYITDNTIPADPVLCAQNTPNSYTYTISDQTISSAKSAVVIKFTNSNSTSNIVLTKVGSNWVITQISCK